MLPERVELALTGMKEVVGHGLHRWVIPPGGPRTERRRAYSAATVSLLTGVIASLVSACCSSGGGPRDIDHPDLVFLQSPQVSRQAVEATLGAPAFTFEDGRVVIYAGTTYCGQFHIDRTVLQYQGELQRLVLVYRADGTVERWKLLDINR
jgi:hypothetical protein